VSKKTIKTFAGLAMLAAGVLLLVSTLFGCFALLGLEVPPRKWLDAFLEICLIAGFPTFLLSFRSLRIATIALWLYFAALWCARCLVGVPPHFFVPYDIYGVTTFTAVVLVQIAYVALYQVKTAQHPQVKDIFSW
jgi:hypothetical protein